MWNPNSSSRQEIRAVSDVLTARARSEGSQAALSVDGSHPLTFGEWERRANGVARGLLEEGIRRGQRVGLMFGSDDWIGYAVAYLACLKAGATLLHVSDDLPKAEIQRRFEQCGVGVVVHSAAQRPPQLGSRFVLEDLEREAAEPVWADVGPEDVADIVYTAGTTAGLPKPVVVRHGDHLHGFDPERHRAYDASRYFLAPFPAGTSSSQNILLFAITGAPVVVVLSRFDADFLCERVHRLAVDDLMITPGMAVALAASGAEQRHDLSSVRSLALGASALPASLVERLGAMFPRARLTQFYLSLESVPSMTSMPFDPHRPGAVGKPGPGTELEIRDRRGTALDAGEVGEIWMRSAGRIRSYDGGGNGFPATFVNGWVYTGDLGSLDQEGILYFFDRAADAISCGGERLSTVAIEDVLYRHPGVVDACVVGIADRELGEIPAAAVVLANGTDVEEVEAFARDQLGERQAPRRFLVEHSIPRGLIGKPLKREVRQWFDQEQGEEARRERRGVRRYW